LSKVINYLIKKTITSKKVVERKCKMIVFSWLGNEEIGKK